MFLLAGHSRPAQTSDEDLEQPTKALIEIESKPEAPTTGCALYLDIRNGVPYPGRAIGKTLHLLARGDAGQHQDRP